jgi:hypothetical protein
MKAAELRIGNWIHLSSLTDGTEVDLQCGLFHLGELNSIKYYYKPIPLTEEWIKRFEIELREDDNTHMAGKVRYEINTHSPYNYFYVIDSIANDMGDYVHVEIKIEYVHQLQNLYFSLTGEELTYKP